MTQAEVKERLLHGIARVKSRLVPCIHLGAPTGETRDCRTCGGSVSLKVLACGIHGKCTPVKNVNGVVCCKGCRDYTT